MFFLGRRSLFHVSFFYPKDLDQTAQMRMHPHADLELCWSDVSWTSLYVSFKFFFFFSFANILTGPYFTYVFLLQRTSSNCGCSLY